MQTSLKSNLLPESYQEFVLLVTTDRERFRRCIHCSKVFGTATVFTSAGWRETQISGWCEWCFDETFRDAVPEEGDHDDQE